MKCETCGLEMELYQSASSEMGLIKRYRCVCGFEKAEIIQREVEKPKRYDKTEKWDTT